MIARWLVIVFQTPASNSSLLLPALHSGSAA
jgi:hypothetical protein